MNQLRFTCLGLVAVCVLAGCTTPAKTSTSDKPAEQKAEYVRETPTGSWITKKVKKAPTSETDTAQSQQALEDLKRRANRTPTDSGN